MIKPTDQYNDGKEHVHVLSFGAGTQSSAMLIMALKGEINGTIPDYIIFSDTGNEPDYVYEWLETMRKVAAEYGAEIHICSNGNIYDDIMDAYANDGNSRSIPLFVKRDDGKAGMILRQCTYEYKIRPVNEKIRELLGYKKGQRIKEMVHVWKGISTDEIQRVKMSQEKWIEFEYPFIFEAQMSRSQCIEYVKRTGIGTPAKSSCIICPFRPSKDWAKMKREDPEAFEMACKFDEAIRHKKGMNNEQYLHRALKPLREVDLGESQLSLFDDDDSFDNECEGFCGV